MVIVILTLFFSCFVDYLYGLSDRFCYHRIIDFFCYFFFINILSSF